MSSTLGASLLRTVLSDGTLKILGSGLDKGPIIQGIVFKLSSILKYYGINIALKDTHLCVICVKN